MSKVKLTKNELKRQRDSLAQFLHYLPTLQLKKQQLQIKIFEIKKELEAKERQLSATLADIRPWLGLLADPLADILPWVRPRRVVTDVLNVAGADVPVFRSVEFAAADYDLYLMPLWTDAGIARLKAYVSLLCEQAVIRQQVAVLARELMVTTQRVNLFEKVKIPDCLENIRKIRIYLGDQQANSVGVSKVAKRKIEQAVLAEMGV